MMRIMFLLNMMVIMMIMGNMLNIQDLKAIYPSWFNYFYLLLCMNH